MKKLFIACVVLMAAVLTSNAQLFVGGSVGLDFGGGTTKRGNTSSDKPTHLAIEFSPKVGFYLSDDFAIGLEVGFFNALEKTKGTGGSSDIKDNTFGWGFSPFARYNVIGGEKLSLLLEGAVAIQGYKSKYTSGSTTSNGNPVTAFSVGILPVLSYSLSDRLDIEASCDFLRFGFQTVIVKSSANSDNKNISNNFGFGINSSFQDFHGTGSTPPDWKVGVVFRF